MGRFTKLASLVGWPLVGLATPRLGPEPSPLPVGGLGRPVAELGPWLSWFPNGLAVSGR